jgi:membrane protease YdiL (CAAX protease family)
VISSVTFGLVHILSNSGWEIGKLPVATYAGFVFGYLYIRYGFHVAVLAHWGDDYLSSVFSFLGQGAPANSLASNTGYLLDQVLTFDMLELIGFASFLLVAYLGTKRLREWRAARASLAVG